MSQWQEQKALVLETALSLVNRGLVIGASGNVSVRLTGTANDLLAVTPTSRAYESLTPDDIQVVDFEGRVVEGTLAPSMETNLHIDIYRSRPGVQAVIHTHAVFASAVAVTGRDIPPILDDQVIHLGGAVRCATYAPSGSAELAGAALEALGDGDAVILRNHGAVCTGVSIADALTACEILEKTARIYLLASITGHVSELSPAAIAFDRAMYDRHQTSSRDGLDG